MEFASQIRQRIASDPHYRWRSSAEIEIAAQLGMTIDVNQASIDDWLRLPGISIHQARNLVSLSQQGVPFHSIDDLAAALGISVQYVRPWLPVLQFCYYHADEKILKLSVNFATIAELTQVPGIDGNLADRIVTQRSVGGCFQSLPDFQQRLQLDGETIGKLMYYIQF
jgi:DNA uptake protein ComE-like DNA-binding protein